MISYELTIGFITMLGILSFSTLVQGSPWFPWQEREAEAEARKAAAELREKAGDLFFVGGGAMWC